MQKAELKNLIKEILSESTVDEKTVIKVTVKKLNRMGIPLSPADFKKEGYSSELSTWTANQTITMFSKGDEKLVSLLSIPPVEIYVRVKINYFDTESRTKKYQTPQAYTSMIELYSNIQGSKRLEFHWDSESQNWTTYKSK